MEWKKVKIGEIGKVVTGKTPRTSIAENYGGNIPFLTPSDDLAQKFAPVTNKTLTEQGLREVKNCLIPANSVCVSCIGSDLGKVVMNREPLVTNQQINSIIPHEDVDAHFVYYAMIEIGKHLNHLSKTSTAVPIINKSTFSNTELAIPSLEDQRRIAAILSSLDDKIENNNRINRNLEAQAQALFKSWFVDFEPFGGTMPEDWKKGNLLDVADLFDHKRIPLSGMQRDRMEKIYPYYGATSVMDYVDNYLYDGIYLLMGEDGSVMTDEGFPFLQYVEGKFWCNNHAHIMQGKNGYTTEMLYCLLNRTNVSGIVTGAVQGKISQASMKKIPVVLPPAKVCADMSGKLAPYFDEIRSLRQESQRLAALRDTLLPKLMKGEIEV